MKQKMSISELRNNYGLATLDREDLNDNPIEQFRSWFDEAQESEVPEPNAMTLSTVNASGQPSGRIVLLKDVDDDGFTFYTNYGSDKARDMATNPSIALNFLWLEIQRQVRIEGRVEKVSEETSRAYFQSRPKESQIGAWVSEQSSVIESREQLEQLQIELREKYSDQEVLPLPPNWGGYKVSPTCIEFWQGRISRLHDRFRYSSVDNQWVIERLAP